MKRLSFLLFGLLLLSFSCRDKDDEVQLSTCPDGGTYALDFRPAFFNQNYLWLTELDGDVAFDEDLSLNAFGLAFLNFPEACEEVYTVSSGSWQVNYGLEPDELVQSLKIIEVGEVPKGSVLDLLGGVLNLGGFTGYLPNTNIEINNCPPIDSVRFWVNHNENLAGDYEVPFSYEYFPEDSVLLVTTVFAPRLGTDALLAFRSAAGGSWNGQLLGRSLPAVLAYEDLEPLVVEELRLDWPANTQDAELEIRWINSVVGQSSLILAFEEGMERSEIPVPVSATGPFAVRAKWTTDKTYETQYVYDSWPAQITIGSVIEGEVLSFDYPELRYEASGVDIIMIDGIFLNPATNDVAERDYAGPGSSGTTSIRFAPLSPTIGSPSSRVGRLHERGFDGDTAFNFYRFPAMGGSYQWYLRNILSDLATGEEWLQSLEYERLILPL